MSSLRLWAGLALILVVHAVSADSHSTAMDGSPNPIEAPLERPRLGLRLAALSFPVSGFDAESARYFNQGVAAVHGFWTFEAERNFREVMRRLPNHPIPVAFAAFAQAVFASGDTARAAEYMKLAHEKFLAGGTPLTQAEALWFEAIAALFDGRLETPEKRQAVHTARLREILDATNDADVVRETKAFLALALWSYQVGSLPADKPETIPLREEVDRLIEDVLREIPGHPAHHYKIHLWNDKLHEIFAKDSARICGLSNPDCAHLWHMPSHIFAALKEFRDAAYNFEAAHRVDNLYLKSLLLPGHVIHNYAHNIEFFLSVLSSSGGVDRALSVARNMIPTPRFFHAVTRYSDPVDKTVEGLLKVLEQHLLWDEAMKLFDEGYFKGLFDRKDDLLPRARLSRFIGLMALEKGRWPLVSSSLEEIRRIRAEAVVRVPQNVTEMEELEKLEEDLRHWETARKSAQPLSLVPTTIERLKALKVSPIHRIALLVAEDGRSDAAVELARAAVAESPAEVMPRAVLSLLLVMQGEKGEAKSQWEILKNLIHVPRHQEKTGAKALSIEGAFPFLNRLAGEFKKQEAMGDPSAFFGVPSEGRQHTLETWLKANGLPTADALGPFHVEQPKAPVGPGHELLWEPLQGKKTEEVARRLVEGTEKGKGLVIIFRQEGCPNCDLEQKNFVENWQTKFLDQGYEALFLYPAAEAPVTGAGVSYLFDPNRTVFKAFGTYDRFTEAPVHGIFLLSSGSKVRWSVRTPHAFSNWEGLHREALRLNGLP